jgi:hypothetical protein
MGHPDMSGWWWRTKQRQQQIPSGDDNKKGKYNRKCKCNGNYGSGNGRSGCKKQRQPLGAASASMLG